MSGDGDSGEGDTARRVALRAAVAGWVEQAAQSGDPTVVLDPAATHSAQQLAALVRADADTDLESALLVGRLYWFRYLALNTRPDRDIAVEMLLPRFLAAVVQLPPPLLGELAQAALPSVLERIEQAIGSQDRDVVNAAIELGYRTLAAVEQPGALPNYLAGVVLHRFALWGLVTDLDAAVQLMRRALESSPTGHPDRPMYLSNLGDVLRTRFEHTGTPEDLDEAIALGRDAVETTPIGNVDRAAYESNLVGALQRRYERHGDADDLDEAISIGRAAVAAIAEDNPDRAAVLANLSGALQTRSDRTAAARDLDEAVQLGHRAIDALGADSHDRAMYLSNLAGALQRRYTRLQDRADLDAALSTGRRAVAAIIGEDPRRAMYLSNLGNTLRVRFERFKAPADLDEAIAVGRRAVLAADARDPSRALYLANLSNSLGTRFAASDAQSDLDEALLTGGQAVDALPPAHPDRARYLFDYGLTQRTRFARSDAQADLREAVERFAEAVESEAGAPTIRIRAAQQAADLDQRAHPQPAAELLARAVELLPLTAPRPMARTDQQHRLAGFAGLTADAAALALGNPSVPEAERPAIALQLLETGRAVLLARALRLRDDLSRLHDAELAQRFTQLRDQLDEIPDPTTMAVVRNEPLAFDVADRALRDRQRLTDELDELLARIRAVKGLETFGQPPTHDELIAEAADGPVVVFNISEYRCDALLLTSSGVTGIPLPGLSRALVEANATAFQQALSVTRHGTTIPARQAAEQELRRILAWLWDNATGPVLEVLGHRQQLTCAATGPRIWWVPGGLLGLLPVHAAGHHTDPPDPAARTVLDRVVSSYTPSVTALRYARRQPTTATPRQTRALIVRMPTTPGWGVPLKYVPNEASTLATILPGTVTLSEPDPGQLRTVPAESLPTKANVLDHLRTRTIAHFACHGISDPVYPHLSRLLLHDHDSDPLNVAALGPVYVEHAELAYLSACETALVKDTELIDEAIHLAAAFQLAGYPHVIGTQWTVDDGISGAIADNFYAALATTPDGDAAGEDATLDVRRTAAALHDAIRTVREGFRKTPSLWAAHLHSGA